MVEENFGGTHNTTVRRLSRGALYTRTRIRLVVIVVLNILYILLYLITARVSRRFPRALAAPVPLFIFFGHVRNRFRSRENLPRTHALLPPSFVVNPVDPAVAPPEEGSPKRTRGSS